MTWEDLEDALSEEIDRLREIPLHPELPGWGHCSANWSLREEHTHQAVVEQAFEQRLRHGHWPDTLTPVQRWLVALRLRALRDHIELVSAWGAPEEPNVEAPIERVAVQQWPKLRQLEHVKAWVHLPWASIDDPFDDGAPPRWVDG